jgi:hypothetical protein
MKYRLNYLLIGILLFTLSCTQPMDPVIESVTETKSELRDKTWQLTDYQVTVKNPDIPPPLLIPYSDSMIEAGSYHLSDMLPGDTDFPQFFVQFTEDNEILSDTVSEGDFVGLGGKYFVINDLKIRINPKGVEKLNYEYYYSPDNKTMTFTLTEEDASKAIDRATQRFIDDVIHERPKKIGEAIADKIHNSPKINGLIKKWIKHGLAGKLPGIFDRDIVKTTEQLSEHVRIHILDSINWKHVLKDAIKHELDKIHGLSDKTLPALMAAEMVTQLEIELTASSLYDIIYPYMDGLQPQSPEYRAEQIAVLIVTLLGDIFSEENLEKIIEPIWEKFTQLSDQQIDTIALTFTEIVQDNWLNVDNLTALFLPITQKIDDTPVRQLNELAQEATDSLEVFVGKLNNRFPGLGLDPDYDTIESAIHAAFIAAKPIIGAKGAEAVAQEIATLIINNFLNTANIEGAFVKALDYLQSIDPTDAAKTIAQWLVSLEKRLAPELIQALAEKLGPILENQNPKGTSKLIANNLRDFTNQHFNKGNISEIVLTELNKTVQIDGKALAKHIAQAIINNKLAKEGVDVEQLAEIIRPALDDNGGGSSFGDRIKDAMADNDVILKHKPEILAKIISFILYKESFDRFKIANNFGEATIIIKHE